MSADGGIHAEALAVGYGGHAVVDGIDLDVAPGQALALVGTNGSGKSTLLKTMIGLLTPIAGHLSLLGARPGTEPARVAYLAQTKPSRPPLPLRAIDVVRMGRFAHLGLRKRRSAHDEQLVAGAIDAMDLGSIAARPLGALSGGQRQRVYLAQVIAHDAHVLLLDEPTTGLDLAGRERYRQVFDAARARGAIVVTATHDIGEANACEQVLLLAGRVVARGRPSEALTAEHLLAAFGIALAGLDHGGHHDLIPTDHPHAHD